MPNEPAPAFERATFTLSQKRLRRLGRATLRRSYGAYFWFSWIWLAFYLGGMIMAGIFAEDLAVALSGWAGFTGWRASTIELALLAVWIVIFIAGLIIQRRFFRREMEQRVNSENQIELQPRPSGLALVSQDIEHHIRWPAIHQVLLEPDGLGMVHGGLTFFVPSASFATPSAYRQFRDHVVANLTPAAIERSQKDLAKRT